MAVVTLLDSSNRRAPAEGKHNPLEQGKPSTFPDGLHRRGALINRSMIVMVVVMINISQMRQLFEVPSEWIPLAPQAGEDVNWTLETMRREQLVHELESFNHRFYVYDDPNVTQVNTPSSIAPLYCRRYCHEAETEIIIHQYLQKHALRVENAAYADLFIAPISPGRILTSRGLSWDVPFQSLTSHPLFQKHQGNKHIMVSNALVTYNYENRMNVRPMLKWLPSMVNVTAALAYDPVGIWEAYENGDFKGSDYEHQFSMVRPMAHHSFSIGIGVANHDFPIVPASMEKYENSTYFLFYRTREGPSVCNSTPFRHAPVHNLTLTAFPPSSVGFDMSSKEEWLSHFQKSKFCLAIRGDTPHSHALLRSVRAGCIPVVISDDWPAFATTLKSSLTIEDYSIIIQEDDFIANPQGTLLKLTELQRPFIENKIANLALAQQVLLPDHPNSLFVESFLKEALVAMEKTSPEFV